MTSKLRALVLIVAGIFIGTTLASLVIWNPVHWKWADDLVGRDHGTDMDMASDSSEKQLWTCGIHPQIIRDEPGSCPVCGMRLVPVKESSRPAGGMGAEPESHEGHAAGQAKKERKVKYWRAPMDPNFISDQPGKSPMGMDLVPVYEDEASVEGGVRVDSNFLQNFAVRTAVVEKGSIPIEIRTVGSLSHNPEKLYSVNTKFTGWIEKSYYNNIGEHVQRGDVLFEIYSPDLVTTQQEYLAALVYLQKLSSSGYPDAVDRARSLLEAARERLRYWDITEDQIRELEEMRKARRTLKILSPASGFIVEKMTDSLEGMQLTPGMTAYKLADHTTLWTEVELYEHQIQHLRLGQSVRVKVDSFPDRTWRGRIVLFDPAVNPQTRTLKAYVEVDNKDLKLRPQMYANILIRPPGVSGVVKVPQQAILHSGERSVVIVQKEKGVFEPREVELGLAGDGYQAVRSGLQPGEIIVTSSQFLIDSESNLKAAISQMLGARSSHKSTQEEGAKLPIQQH